LTWKGCQLQPAIDLLVSRRVGVLINDGLSLLDFRKHKPDTPITIVVKHPDSARNGFVFRKGGRELVDAFHTAPDDRMNDGTYQKISEKWFGADVSK
jgi:cystine transport system substrate-binding protein